MEVKDIKQLTHTLAKTVEKLTETVDGLERRIKKVVTANLNKLEKAEVEARRCNTKLSKRVNTIAKDSDTIKKAIMTQIKSFDGIQETFYTLYHNIKKNQWKYTAEPEEWYEDYLDLKKHYKKENKEA